MKAKELSTGRVITISGVRAYLDENGTAWINAEDAARGLGFTKTPKHGNQTVCSKDCFNLLKRNLNRKNNKKYRALRKEKVGRHYKKRPPAE